MVLLNSTDLIGWDPGFAFADWLGSKTWCGYVVQLATLCYTTVSLKLTSCNCLKTTYLLLYSRDSVGKLTESFQNNRGHFQGDYITPLVSNGKKEEFDFEQQFWKQLLRWLEIQRTGWFGVAAARRRRRALCAKRTGRVSLTMQFATSDRSFVVAAPLFIFVTNHFTVVNQTTNRFIPNH